MKSPLNEVKKIDRETYFSEEETKELAKHHYLFEIQNPLYGSHPDEPKFYGLIIPRELGTKK